MSGLELFAAALGVIAVWLTVKQNPWCWPIGLVMVLLYTWIFFDVKLYSDMLLQVVYAVLQLDGVTGAPIPRSHAEVRHARSGTADPALRSAPAALARRRRMGERRSALPASAQRA
nr:hypothetical protein [Tanacetum cinerariifolium]